MAKNGSGFWKSLVGRRAQVQQGPDVQDLAKIAQDQGYDFMQTKNGDIVPVPKGSVNDGDMDSFQNRWSTIDNSTNDLVNNRNTRLSSYDKMDRSGGEGAVLLDVLADEVINITDYSESSLMINISDEAIKAKVFQVLESNSVFSNMRSDIRSLCKYGDFAYLMTRSNLTKLADLTTQQAEQGSVLKVSYNPEDIELTYLQPRFYELEHSSNRVYRLIIDNTIDLGNLNLPDSEYYPWEYSIFNVSSRDTFPYGMSELEKMRLPWEKLAILEELLAITRANRLDKIAITVPGLKGDPTSVLNRLSQLKNSIRNTILGFNGSGSRISRNQDTGMTDYLWVPEGFKAEKLSTSIEVASTEDVEYFRDKLINASRLPKGFFLASEAGGNQRPMSLRQQDIKFARSLIPIGEAYCRGLRKLIIMVAFYLGADVSKLKVDVAFKKSPYITDELIGTYKGVYDIVQTFKELKSEFSETREITDVDLKRILDLVGAPHTLVFPEQESQKKRDPIKDSVVTITSCKSLMEASLLDLNRVMSK